MEPERLTFNSCPKFGSNQLTAYPGKPEYSNLAIFPPVSKSQTWHRCVAGCNQIYVDSRDLNASTHPNFFARQSVVISLQHLSKSPRSPKWMHDHPTGPIPSFFVKNETDEVNMGSINCNCTYYSGHLTIQILWEDFCSWVRIKLSSLCIHRSRILNIPCVPTSRAS